MVQLVSTGVDWNGIEDFVGMNDDGSIIMKRVCHDVEPVIDRNKALRNHGHNGYTPSKDLQHVASIPIGLIEVWKAQYGVDPTAREHKKLLARLLNDHTLSGLRTGGGWLDFKE